MGTVLNFDNVNDEQKSVYKSVKKGAQVLTIVNLEEGNAASGNPFVEVTFHSERDDADFKHKFFLTEKALPKLMDLIKGCTGTKPTGNLDTDALPALLVGQSSNFIVDADVIEKEKDGKVYKNEYATFLRFRDFCNKTTPFADEDARTKEKSIPASVMESIESLDNKDNDELPW